jgi:8-oxo-dGTP pyrophosphatase MutT (NUDIX family)
MSYVETIREKIGHDPLLLIGSNVIIRNTQGEFLLQKRSSGMWGLLGGLLELGESLESCALREVFEESGLVAQDLKLIHVFSGKDYHFILPNQDEIYVTTALYEAQSVSGTLQADGMESLDLQYFSADKLPENMEEEYRIYLDYFVKKTSIHKLENS